MATTLAHALSDELLNAFAGMTDSQAALRKLVLALGVTAVSVLGLPASQVLS